MKPKVYQINDCDWWAGYGLESTKAAYIEETGVTAEDAFDEPRELTDEDMMRLQFTGDGESLLISFHEQLDKMISENIEFPCFFASTEY